MRMLLAAAIISVGISATVAAAIFLQLDGSALYLFLVTGALTSFVSGLRMAQHSFRHGDSSPVSIEELEQQGLLEVKEFAAVRAFQVEEYEDEGLHYFLKLTDARVLYLQGQYLDEYEPELSQRRRFPCTEFSIVRDSRSGEIADLRCRGVPIEPEAVLPPFPAQFFLTDEPYAADQLIADRSYEEIKAELEILTARQ